MAVYETGDYRFHSASSTGLNAEGKSLIVSTHGAYLSGGMNMPRWTHLAFLQTKRNSLVADLRDVIGGRITPVGIPLGTKRSDDYRLDHFEHDPPDSDISAALSADADVLTLKQGTHTRLSDVLAALDSWGSKYQYPQIVCVFCRVDASGKEPYATVRGSHHTIGSQAHTQRKMAQMIANELHQKGLAR